MLRRVKSVFSSKLLDQLETIRQIGAVVLKFCVPLDTIVSIMKLSLFALSLDRDMDLFIEVSGVIASYCKHASLGALFLSECRDSRKSAQLIVSSFCSLLFHAVSVSDPPRLPPLLQHLTAILANMATVLRTADDRARASVLGIYFLMGSSPMSRTRALLLALDSSVGGDLPSEVTECILSVLELHGAVDDSLRFLTPLTCTELGILGVSFPREEGRSVPVTVNVPQVCEVMSCHGAPCSTHVPPLCVLMQ